MQSIVLLCFSKVLYHIIADQSTTYGLRNLYANRSSITSLALTGVTLPHTNKR